MMNMHIYEDHDDATRKVAASVVYQMMRHLDEQGYQAMDDNGGCVYYNPHNYRRCSVGGLATPEQWAEWRNETKDYSLADIFVDALFSLSPSALSPSMKKFREFVDETLLKELSQTGREYIVELMDTMQVAHDAPGTPERIWSPEDVYARFTARRSSYGDTFWKWGWQALGAVPAAWQAHAAVFDQAMAGDVRELENVLERALTLREVVDLVQGGADTTTRTNA